MVDPLLQHTTKTPGRRLAIVELNRKIKVFIACPVVAGIFFVQYIQINRLRGHRPLLEQVHNAAKLVGLGATLNRLGIGGHHYPALLNRNRLRSKEKFRHS